ncbi:MAG: type II toxin-antitoxin system HicA family toxin [Planctomycetota bacterium]
MKRRDLEKHLKAHGCEPAERSGRGPHDIWWNPTKRTTSAIPRKKEIKTGTGRAICDDLGVPRIDKV